MMVAADVAGRLGLKRYPRSWRGRCPACDYSGTFSVRARRDGRALLFCASCQDRDALTDAVMRATGQEFQREPRDDRGMAAAPSESRTRRCASGADRKLPPAHQPTTTSHCAVCQALRQRPRFDTAVTHRTRKAGGCRR
jgi:hypothetical protein